MFGKKHMLFKLILLGSVIASCENEDCVSVSNNALLVEFYSRDSTVIREIAFEYITAASTDTVFYAHGEESSSYALPLNPAADATMFYMQAIDTVLYDTISADPLQIDTVVVLRDRVDTLAVQYNRTQRVITPECGVEISYGNIEVEQNTFSGGEVVSPSLSRFNDVNIKIYY
jgi:hypothetical protein